MSDAGPLSQSDLWMAEYKKICDELESHLVGVDGTQCGVRIEVWEHKHRNNPRVGSFVVNRARMLQMMLRKNPEPGTVVVMQGDNLNFQQGTSNVSNSSGNIAAGDSNQIVQSTEGETSPTTVHYESATKGWANITVGIAAGLLAGWWCLPDWMAIGRTRFATTIVLVTVSATMGALNWFAFRRRNWEKLAYIGLGSVLVLHSAVPSFAGGGSATGEITSDTASGTGLWYVSFAEDPFYSTIEVACGVFVLCLAFFANRPTDAP